MFESFLSHGSSPSEIQEVLRQLYMNACQGITPNHTWKRANRRFNFIELEDRKKIISKWKLI